MPDPRINDLGFAMSDQCKLLGFVISPKKTDFSENFEEMLTRVRKTINFWKIFNLSLSGKIVIVKTLIYPVLNYYLTVLPVQEQWLDTVTKMIENFVLQGFNLSKDKLYQDPDLGGLGFFEPRSFFRSLNCSWIKRCSDLTHDIWRRILIDCAGNDSICYIQKNCVSERGPILKNIVDSFVLFRNAFGTIRNNYLFCPLLNNSCFSFKIGGDKRILDDEFFNNNLPNLVPNRKTLCFSDFTDAAGNTKSINQLRTQIDRTITADCARIIRSCMINIKKKFSADLVAACAIHDFMGKIN
jgi:hypothetical protein